ncbi:MAG TPA: exopolysaccharide biosynthesis polyprenyl glycosylphosphotransferase [Solirubrobacterales bacterium]|nr:exopolysaccharide biosynthesis polyprenyl glycosylphosphotransferase [Solirubrobacterales bacterium]
MSSTSKPQTPALGAPGSPPPSPVAPPPRRQPSQGALESRRRGALLRRLLALGDWAALIAALCVVTLTTSTTDVGTLFWAILFSPAWILVVKLHGLYDKDHRRIRHSTLDEVPSLISASVLGTLTLDGLLALSPAGPLSPTSAIGVGVVTLLGSFVMRGVLRFLWHRLTALAPGLVIGPAKAVDIVARRVATHPETRLALVGYLSAEEPVTASELPRLGSIADISEVARELAIERVVVTEQEMSEVAAEGLIEECKAEGLALTFLPQHYGLLGPGIELNRLAELPVLDFRFSDPPRSTVAMKRAMDIAVSALLLALLSPLLLAVAVAILLDEGRPVFFRQRRAGKDGKPFTMVKFRTMVSDAEQRLPELVDLQTLDQPAFKIRDDPRITRSGRWLRRTSIDELPQLINVLWGQMSLVGPRPEEESVVALYDERQRGRLAIKPGLTGPMQVYGRSDLTFEERLALERDYLDNLSLLTDLAILMRTPRAMIRGEGAY